jgi:hypothetical protein
VRRAATVVVVEDERGPRDRRAGNFAMGVLAGFVLIAITVVVVLVAVYGLPVG